MGRATKKKTEIETRGQQVHTQQTEPQDQATTGKREKTHTLDVVTLRFKSPRVCEVLI